MLRPVSLLINAADELRGIVAILAVTDLLARAVVAHQDIELPGGVSFSNGDVIGLIFAAESHRIGAICVLHRIHFAGNVGVIVEHATLRIINGCRPEIRVFRINEGHLITTLRIEVWTGLVDIILNHRAAPTASRSDLIHVGGLAALGVTERLRLVIAVAEIEITGLVDGME